MTTTRTHFTFRVDTWTPDGESIVEHIAGVEDYELALVTFRAGLRTLAWHPHHLAAGCASGSRTAGACAWLGLTRGGRAGVRDRNAGRSQGLSPWRVSSFPGAILSCCRPHFGQMKRTGRMRCCPEHRA